jgi:hypothetical protein
MCLLVSYSLVFLTKACLTTYPLMTDLACCLAAFHGGRLINPPATSTLNRGPAICLALVSSLLSSGTMGKRRRIDMAP